MDTITQHSFLHVRNPRQIGADQQVTLRHVENGIFLTINGKEFVAESDIHALNIIQAKLKLTQPTF